MPIVKQNITNMTMPNKRKEITPNTAKLSKTCILFVIVQYHQAKLRLLY